LGLGRSSDDQQFVLEEEFEGNSLEDTPLARKMKKAIKQK
jgi:hypothetical protein